MAHALAALVAMLAVVSANPEIVFPFNSQLPPIARVGSPFNFTFSTNTFRPAGGDILYTVSGEPAWLQFDAVNRTLWGTPGTADAITAEFTITASDAHGSTPMPCRLKVSSDPAPSSSVDLPASLGRSGQLVGPASLLVHPEEKIEIAFSPSNFHGSGKPLDYYATLGDHTPLPSWLTFNAQTVRITGKPPKMASYPQSFDILVIASDVPNFAGVWVKFTVVVSDNVWAFQPEEQTRNIRGQGKFTIDDLGSSLYSGDSAYEASDLKEAKAQTPPWLHFDSNSLALSGTPPTGTKEASINISAWNRNNDVATLRLHLRFGSLLKNSIGPLHADIGQKFNYTIRRSDLVEPDLSVSFDLGRSGSWLHFDPMRLDLSGTAPKDLKAGMLSLSMTLTTANHSQTDTSTIELQLQDPENDTDTDGTPSDASTTSDSHAASPEAHSARGSSISNGELAAIIVCPILAVLTAIILLICCLRRRRQKASPKAPPKFDISRPLVDQEDRVGGDMEKGDMTGPTTPEKAPQIEFSLSPPPPPPPARTLSRPNSQQPKVGQLRSSQVPQSLASSILEEREAETLENFNRSSWGYGPQRAPSTRPHDSMKIPTVMARGSRISKQLFARQGEPRLSTVSKANQKESTVHQRIPGRGHGRNSEVRDGCDGSFCLAGSGHGRKSAGSCPYCRYAECVQPLQPHTEINESLYGATATSMASTAPSAWPIPPTWQSKSASRVPKLSNFAATIRSAKATRSGAGSETSGLPLEVPDRRSLFEKRQSYIRHRAINRSPFFASTRASTHSRKESSTPSATQAKHVTAASQTSLSLKRFASRKPLTREYSASSSLEPSREISRGRERMRSKWALPEGFPRALSKARNSMASGLRFEDASDSEWERQSFSVYSDDGDETVAGAQRSPRASLRATRPAKISLDVHERPKTQPPSIPLPAPPTMTPSRSPRISALGSRSQTQPNLPAANEALEYSPSEEPSIEQPEIAVAVSQARLSRLSDVRHKSDNLGGKRKFYPNLKRGSVMERPRSSFRPPKQKTRPRGSERQAGHTDTPPGPVSPSDSVPGFKGQDKSEPEESGNEAFI